MGKKAINIFAILFFAFNAVGATKKMTNFDDIVSSFAQIQDPSTDGLAKINEISESFADSNKILLEMQSHVEGMCTKIDTDAAAFLVGTNKKIAEFKLEIKNIDEENLKIGGDLKKNIGEQKEEVKKIEDAKADIKKERE